MDYNDIRKVYKFHFVFSTCILVLSAILLALFNKNGVDQNTPLTWSDYSGKVLYLLVPGAIYGLFSRIPLKKINQGLKEKGGYATGMLTIGVCMFLFAWLMIALGHLDCGSACVASVPTYTAGYIMLFIQFLLLIVYPVVLTYKIHKSK